MIPNVAEALLDAYHNGDDVLPPDADTLDILNTLEQATDTDIRRARSRVPRRSTPYARPTPTTQRTNSSQPSRRHQSINPSQTRRSIDAYNGRNNRFDASIT